VPYDLLKGIRVLEVSLLSPDGLGGHLSDLGAEVIKVEEPPCGDYVRGRTPQLNVSNPGSLLHARWNRGKKSVALDLKTVEGREIFLSLAKQSHAVIEGLRSGSMERWGLGYDQLRAINPELVFCSFSGLGRSGPYRSLPTHGVFFDSFAGLLPPERDAGGYVTIPRWNGSPLAGEVLGAVYGALAVVAGILDARRTGQGRIVEVAQAEVAAHWQAFRIDATLNAAHLSENFVDLQKSVRYQYYETKDDRVVNFQAIERKFWHNFCSAIRREDLLERFPTEDSIDHALGNEELRAELRSIFKSRTLSAWVDLFMRHNIAGGPVNALDDLMSDPHFAARENTYQTDYPGLDGLRLLGTPIKLEGERFVASRAPEVGEHTEEVLRDLIQCDAPRLAQLRRSGVVC
jgi:crotonobetainyl-CoA:carnitine CoA-transferase CaiB-like acyl-CoA transferase